MLAEEEALAETIKLTKTLTITPLITKPILTLIPTIPQTVPIPTPILTKTNKTPPLNQLTKKQRTLIPIIQEHPHYLITSKTKTITTNKNIILINS